MTTSSSTSTAKSAKKPRGRNAPKGPSSAPVAPGRGLKRLGVGGRLGVAGAALVVAGGAAYGIDQAVSSSPSHPSAPVVPGTAAPALPGAVARVYLATAPNAVVGIDLLPAAKGYTGTATQLALLAPPPSKSDAFVSYTISATLKGDTLDIGFDGAPKMSTTFKNKSFTIDFPFPIGPSQPLTFKPSSTKAVDAAQAAFRASLGSSPS